MAGAFLRSFAQRQVITHEAPVERTEPSDTIGARPALPISTNLAIASSPASCSIAAIGENQTVDKTSSTWKESGRSTFSMVTSANPAAWAAATPSSPASDHGPR